MGQKLEQEKQQNKLKLKKELQKKKQLQSKQEQDNFFKDLFKEDQQKVEKQESGKSSDSSENSDNSSSESSREDVEISIERDCKQEQNQEQQKINKIEQDKKNSLIQEKREQLKRQQELEERLRNIRFKNRKNVDDLINPILSLDLISKFQQFLSPNNSENDQSNNKNIFNSNDLFPILPLKFNNSLEYQDKWIQLNLFETFNQLINRRNESEKDQELSKIYGFKLKNDNQKKCFNGIIQKGKQSQAQWFDTNYIYFHLYENDQKQMKNQKENQNNQKKDNFEHINCLKEFDLLLISFEELDTQNVKHLTSVDFLLKVQSQENKMMAIVERKRQSDKNFIEIKVHIKHEKFLSQAFNQKQSDSATKKQIQNSSQNASISIENQNQIITQSKEIYVYFFDSLSTRIREFRTIKCAEFYNCSQFIFDPSSIQKSKQIYEIQASSNENQNLNDIKECPIYQQKLKTKPADESSLAMQNFIDGFKDKFNSSQYNAIHQVTLMKGNDFLLIQGPPGTGKTHTIKGIISMINHSFKNQKKILVCAPSNAAIDEIVTRLISKSGLFGQNEADSIKKVLRIGAMDYEPSKIVQKVTFDFKINIGGQNIETVEEKQNYDEQLKKWNTDIVLVDQILKLLSSEQKNIQKIRDLAKQILANIDQIDDFMKYDKKKKQEKLQQYQQEVQLKKVNLLEQRKGQQKNISKAQRKALEKKIIQNAQIICTTLSMSANEKLDYLNPGDIEYLIVDEACQSVELTNLIPFEHRPQKIILVGDQQQLPATTFSENADRTNYSRSMFERFILNGVNRVMLEIQYRMDPLIRQFPSIQFYENRLSDDVSISNRVNQKEFLDSDIFILYNLFSPIQFFDQTYSVEDASESSKTNLDEVEMIENLFKKFIVIIIQQKQSNESWFDSQIENEKKKDYQKYKNLPPVNEENILLSVYKDVRQEIIQKLKGCIGIVTPYKSQVRAIKDKIYKFLRLFADIQHPQELIEINTVDAYQGREKDILIFSCVRANGSLGFISDYRRMNVAITRAKHSLFVIGNSKTLNKDKNWREFIIYCKNLDQQQSKIIYQEFFTKNDQIKTYQFKKVQNKSEENSKNTKQDRIKQDQRKISNIQQNSSKTNNLRRRSNSKKIQNDDRQKNQILNSEQNKIQQQSRQKDTKIEIRQNEIKEYEQEKEEGECNTQDYNKRISQNEDQNNKEGQAEKKYKKQDQNFDLDQKYLQNNFNKQQQSYNQKNNNNQQYYQNQQYRNSKMTDYQQKQSFQGQKDQNDKQNIDDDFDYKSQIQYGQQMNDRQNQRMSKNISRQDYNNDSWKQSDYQYDKRNYNKYQYEYKNENNMTSNSRNGYNKEDNYNRDRYNDQNQDFQSQYKKYENSQDNYKRQKYESNNKDRQYYEKKNTYYSNNQYDKTNKYSGNEYKDDSSNMRKREQKDWEKKQNYYKDNQKSNYNDQNYQQYNKIRNYDQLNNQNQYQQNNYDKNISRK